MSKPIQGARERTQVAAWADHFEQSVRELSARLRQQPLTSAELTALEQYTRQAHTLRSQLAAYDQKHAATATAPEGEQADLFGGALS